MFGEGPEARSSEPATGDRPASTPFTMDAHAEGPSRLGTGGEVDQSAWRGRPQNGAGNQRPRKARSWTNVGANGTMCHCVKLDCEVRRRSARTRPVRPQTSDLGTSNSESFLRPSPSKCLPIRTFASCSDSRDPQSRPPNVPNCNHHNFAAMAAPEHRERAGEPGSISRGIARTGRAPDESDECLAESCANRSYFSQLQAEYVRN